VVTDKRAVEEAAEKAAADKEFADKRTADKVAVKGTAAEAVGDSSALGKAPSLVAGTKRASAPRSSTPPAKRPYRGVWKRRYFFLCFILSISFRTTPLPPARSPRRAPLLLPQVPLPQRPLGVLSVFSVVATTEVEKDVDGGAPGECCRYFRQRPP
jgi:hypothetical protein